MLVMRRQPIPLASLFSDPDGVPCPTLCLFGIYQGVTTADEAVSLLKAHPLTRNLTILKGKNQQGPLRINAWNPDNSDLDLEIDFDQDSRASIFRLSYARQTSRSGMRNLTPRFDLGSVIAIMGSPDYLRPIGSTVTLRSIEILETI